MLAALKHSRAIRHVVMVDACRDNPFSFEDTVAVLDKLRRGAPAAVTTGTQAPARGLGPAPWLCRQPE